MTARSKIAAVAAALTALATRPAAGVAQQIDPPVPPGYAVAVFDNRSGAGSLDWMRVALPFSLAERLEAHPALRPAYDATVLPAGTPPARLDAVAVGELAREQGARFVFSGWFDRAENWDLVLQVELWRADGPGPATLVASSEQRGDPHAVHGLLAAAAADVCGDAGLPVTGAALALLQREPTDDHYAYTLFGRGLLLLHGLGAGPDVERAERARKALSRAVFIDPELASAHRLLAEVHLGRGRLDRALGRFSYALDLAPDYYAAMAGLARLTRDNGELDTSRSLHRQMLARRPWDTMLRFSLGQLSWEMGDVEAARDHLKRVVREKPRLIEARRTLVLIHASRGDQGDLVRELEAVARLEPDDLETRLDLGAAYSAVGRDRDAIQIYRAVAADYPRDILPLKFLGDVHRRRGELKRAIGYYRKALAVDRSDPRPYFLLGRSLVEAGDDRAAKQIYRRALRFAPYLPQTYNNLGAILYREGKPGRALWYLRRAVRKRPDEPDFRYNLALVHSATQDFEAALEHVDAGLLLAPRDPRLHYLHGVVRLRLGDVGEARGSFARAVELDPVYADAQHNLALLDSLERRAARGEVLKEAPTRRRTDEPASRSGR